MSVPASQINESKLQRKSRVINKFLKIYKSLWSRLFPFKDDYKKLYEEVERLKIELKDEKEISFILNKVLDDQKLLQGLDDIQHSHHTQMPNKFDKKAESEVQIMLYENPKVIMDGTRPCNSHLEIISGINFQDHIDEHGPQISIVMNILTVCELLKQHLKLSNRNKTILKSNVKDIVVHWRSDTPSYTFFSIEYFFQVCALSKATEEACFFINNFRLGLKEYLRGLRAAIRNGDVELLKTVLGKLGNTSMYWHNLFPLFSQERENSHPNFNPEEPFAMDRNEINFNLSEYLARPENQDARCFSVLSYALANNASYSIIRTLLDFGVTEKVECRGYTIDVTKELSEFLKLEQQRKFAFLMAFNERLGQDSEIFKNLVKSPIFDRKHLTRAIFDML